MNYMDGLAEEPAEAAPYAFSGRSEGHDDDYRTGGVDTASGLPATALR